MDCCQTRNSIRCQYKRGGNFSGCFSHSRLGSLLYDQIHPHLWFPQNYFHAKLPYLSAGGMIIFPYLWQITPTVLLSGLGADAAASVFGVSDPIGLVMMLIICKQHDRILVAEMLMGLMALSLILRFNNCKNRNWDITVTLTTYFSDLDSFKTGKSNDKIRRTSVLKKSCLLILSIHF